MVNVGGFFASLKLVTDDQSFQKGIGTLEKFPTKLKNIAVGALGVGAGMVAMATTTASALAKLDATATTLGMSARSLDNWKGAVSRAGGDADSFVDSLVQMNEAFRNLKIGEVREDFIKATGMSGANFSSMMQMNNEQRLRTIWGALEKVADPAKQQALVARIFGSGGVDLFSRIKNQGTSLGTLYAQASAQNPLTDKDYQSAIESDKKQREIAQQLGKDFENIGIKISQGLLPALDKFSKWLSTNQDNLDKFATAVGDATKVVVGFVGGIGGWLGSSGKRQEVTDKIFGSGGGLSGVQHDMFATKLLFGDRNAQRLADLFSAGKITADDARRLDSSSNQTARLNLFESGAKGAALSGDAQIGSIIKKAEGTLNIRITSDQPLTAEMQKAISDAFGNSYAMGATR